ncbi:MAG: S24 family peptidase [Desulfovibrio sp.]|nr:S24 family peptidase [Desulfovibrio sp.]
MNTYERVKQQIFEMVKEENGNQAAIMRQLADTPEEIQAKVKSKFYKFTQGNSVPRADTMLNWMDSLGFSIVPPNKELDGFVLVPRVHAKAGAGESWEIDTDIEAKYAFRESFMRYLGVQAKNMIMMYVSGDSMEPLIYDRDTLLVDTSDTNPREGYIYVLNLGDVLMVKRLQKTPRGWNICSENKNYSTITIEGQELESMCIRGRVRWFGRVL